MGALVILLALLGFAVLFAYLKFPPAFANQAQVTVYNNMVLGVCVLLMVFWVLGARGRMAGGPNGDYWPVVAVAGALGIEIIFLGVFFLIRNFYIFKPPRLGGR